MEIIEGVTPATSGEVHYFGEPAGRRFREEAGIQFQNTALQDYLTVRETLEIVDRAYILHDGQVLMSGTPDEVVENENVRRVYLGENFRIS